MFYEDIVPTKLINIYGAFTTAYIFLLMLVLYGTNHLRNIGKLSAVYVIIILVVSDLIKCRFKRYYGLRKEPKKSVGGAITLVVVSLGVFYILPVLFGAPVLSGFEQTFMFSLIVTTLTTVHSLLHLGVKSTYTILLGLTSVDGSFNYTQMILRNVQFTLIGAWCGAVVIPLDWGRWWQDWPIPCTIGAMIGFACGHLVSLVLMVRAKTSRHQSCL